MIRVAKYDFKNKRFPMFEGFTNILIHVKDKLSPYVIFSTNEKGEKILMENHWQFNKLYLEVTQQNQTLHRFTNEKGWVWKYEKHAIQEDDGKITILPSYWKWREEGIKFKHPIRYPNGYYGRHKCLCSLYLNNNVNGREGYDYVIDPKGNKYQILNYIEARKKIYRNIIKDEYFKELRKLYNNGRHKSLCSLYLNNNVIGRDDYVINPKGNKYFKLYREIIIKDEYFKELRKRYNNGECFQIIEVDGPLYIESTDEKDYPYNLAKYNSLFITKKVLGGLIKNTSQCFGHGYCCAMAIMGYKFKE